MKEIVALNGGSKDWVSAWGANCLLAIEDEVNGTGNDNDFSPDSGSGRQSDVYVCLSVFSCPFCLSSPSYRSSLEAA
jgi:hypothetical protein